MSFSKIEGVNHDLRQFAGNIMGGEGLSRCIDESIVVLQKGLANCSGILDAVRIFESCIPAGIVTPTKLTKFAEEGLKLVLDEENTIHKLRVFLVGENEHLSLLWREFRPKVPRRI